MTPGGVVVNFGAVQQIASREISKQANSTTQSRHATNKSGFITLKKPACGRECSTDLGVGPAVTYVRI
jgi:hypothetical protein